MNPKHGPVEKTLALELGRHIFRARVALGVKQEYVAEVLGLRARGSVSNWEKGRRLIREPDWERLRRKAELPLPEYRDVEVGVMVALSGAPFSSSIVAALSAA